LRQRCRNADATPGGKHGLPDLINDQEPTMTMLTPRTLRQRLRAMLACALLTVLASPAVHAALDSTALTDDHSINTPTPWWTYANQSPQQLAERLNEHGARLASLEVTAVTNAGEPRFTARLLANSGAYAVPGWWWFYDQTPEQITALINANTARIIDLERYDRGGGQIRYAVVMVTNSGAARRNWSYLMGVTRGQLGNHISASGHRPIDLDVYGSGNARRYNAVLVANSGSDQRGFDWDTGQTPAQIVARTAAFNGRVVKLGRDGDGTYAFVQVKNNATNASGWWHKYGFKSIIELDNYARQMGARPIDVLSYSTLSGPRFDAALIDNANAEERRMREHYKIFVDANQNPRGVFASYLKEVDGAVLINLNGQRRAETASSLKVLHLLHAMRQVQAGVDTLASNFNYYNYYDGSENDWKDRCPQPEQEINPIVTTLEWGLDQMIDVSDNRTTRAVVLRYGGTFAPFNTTAAWAGMASTTLRHNIGCSYYDVATKTFKPDSLRNETTAADLARVFEGVWNASLLTGANRARLEFLESTFSNLGATGQVQTIINEEAAALGRSANVAADFGKLVKTWGKGGTYDTCVGDPADAAQCGATVLVRSGAGLMRLPVGGVGPYVGFRYYVHGKFISDVPYDNPNAAEQFNDATRKAHAEIFRGVIRQALMSW
jgi:beta-lactamase class A